MVINSDHSCVYFYHSNEEIAIIMITVIIQQNSLPTLYISAHLFLWWMVIWWEYSQSCIYQMIITCSYPVAGTTLCRSCVVSFLSKRARIFIEVYEPDPRQRANSCRQMTPWEKIVLVSIENPSFSERLWQILRHAILSLDKNPLYVYAWFVNCKSSLQTFWNVLG